MNDNYFCLYYLISINLLILLFNINCYNIQHMKETLIKMILNSVLNDELEKIKSNVRNYKVDMNTLIDKITHQKSFFY